MSILVITFIIKTNRILADRRGKRCSSYIHISDIACTYVKVNEKFIENNKKIRRKMAEMIVIMRLS